MKFNPEKAAAKLKQQRMKKKFKIDKLNAKSAAKIGLQKELGKTARVGAIANRVSVNYDNSNSRDSAIAYYNQMIGNSTESSSVSNNNQNIGETNSGVTDNRGR